MIILAQNNDYKPGTWKGLSLTDGGYSASVSCPMCGQLGSLTDHTIAGDGSVTPSLVCPYDDCNFHDYVTLEGWKDDPKI